MDGHTFICCKHFAKRKQVTKNSQKGSICVLASFLKNRWAHILPKCGKILHLLPIESV